MHPSEIAYDFRRFFGISAWDRSISDQEYVHLFESLMNESNSRFTTNLLGRVAPFESSEVALWTMIDLFIQANSDPKKSKKNPVDKPWDQIQKLDEIETKQNDSKMNVDKFDKLQELKDKLYKKNESEIALEEEINLFKKDSKETNDDDSVIWEEE